MLIIRPITSDDYPALMQIAIDTGVGFTSLPINEGLLRSRIKHSEESFAAQVDKPGDQGYLLVMEDTETGEIVGTSGIEASVGLDSAFYHYHLGKVVHSSQELNLHNVINTLTLCNDYTGAAEVCTLFLQEKARFGNNGRVLSRFRFLMLAEFAERFGQTVIAEMRGVSDEEGHSPFFQWLQEHFFNMDFQTVDHMMGLGNKVFIAELMPRYPVYTNLLSQEAQDVIGHVHKKTAPALKLLQREGFVHRGYVDIFDAGPTVECELSEIKSVKQSKRLNVKVSSEITDAVPHIICNTILESFRAMEAQIAITGETAIITPQHADALGVSDNDPIRVLAI